MHAWFLGGGDAQASSPDEISLVLGLCNLVVQDSLLLQQWSVVATVVRDRNLIRTRSIYNNEVGSKDTLHSTRIFFATE